MTKHLANRLLYRNSHKIKIVIIIIRSGIAGIHSGIYSYSGISQTNAPLVYGPPVARVSSLELKV